MTSNSSSGASGFSSKSGRVKRQSEGRKFYKVSIKSGGGRIGLELENKAAIIPTGRYVLIPPPGQRGFPVFEETPCFVFDKRRGRMPRDLEEFHDYWLVSDRMKRVLEAVDAEGIAFEKCETRVPTGESGGDYWLCDVLRIIDAVDEAASNLKIEWDRGHKIYSLMGGANLVFDKSAVGPAHVFRMAHLEASVICDSLFKTKCNAAGLKGIDFRDVSKIGQY
jgi:hypothetical protein